VRLDFTHAVLELVYYVRGTGSSKLRGVRHKVEPHIFSITPAGTGHDQLNDSMLASQCFGISGSGLEKYAGVYRDRGGELGRTCQRLAEEVAATRVAQQMMVDGLVRQMVAQALRAVEESSRKPPARELADRALDIIRRESGMVTVAELSEQLFVSKDYLRHLLKSSSGRSPLSHIIGARIDRARELLAAGELNVSAVAERCGFSSPYYFSRMFKKVTGMTPSEAREARSAAPARAKRKRASRRGAPATR